MNTSSNNGRIAYGIIITSVIAILTNLATNVIPKAAEAYLWMSWPLLAAALGIHIYRETHQPPPTPPSRTNPTSASSHNIATPNPIPIISKHSADGIPILPNNTPTPLQTAPSDWYDTLSFAVVLVCAIVGFVLGATGGGFGGAIGGFLIGFFASAALMQYLRLILPLGVIVGVFLLIMYVGYFLFKLIVPGG